MRKLLNPRLVVCLIVTGCATTPPENQLPNLVQQANYVFRATIETVGASNMSAVPTSERTVVAKVEAVFEGAATQGDFTGRSITVLLPAGRVARAGESLDVFGMVLAYGETLAVDAFDVLEPEGDLSSRTDQVKAAIAQNRDEALRARLENAELVLLGTVTAEPKLLPQGSEVAASEHDPLWRVVEVRAEQVLKGNAETVSVVIASSDDIRWFRSPKPKPRTRGIFILRMQERQDFPARGYLLFDPRDFRPVAELDRVKGLIEK